MEATPRAREGAGPRVAGAVVVAAVAAVPAAFYVGGLGFYLDDHYLLGLMSTAHDRSVPGLFHVLADDNPVVWGRPAMYLILATLFRLFGTNALPYHVFVAALVPLCAVLLYAILDHLRAPRFLALSVPILFAAAPHYSTDRFWLASFAAPASVALALLGIYASLRARVSTGRRLAGWLLVDGVALVLSVLMYEVAIPLLLVAVALLWYRGRADSGTAVRVAGFSSLVLGAVLAAKVVLTATLASGASHQFGYQSGFLHHLGYLVSGGVKVNFGTYGLGLPYVVSWIVVHRLTWTAVTASALVGIGTFVYLARAARELELLAGRGWRLLVAAGLALLVVGYGSFLVTETIYFTSAGIDNRVNIVAAIGVAALAVGLVLRVVELLPVSRRRLGTPLAVAVLAATGTLITNTLADYWVAADSRQREVVSALTRSLPAHLTDTTVVLDGVCPEIGPGVVYASPYDLGGELRMLYRDATIRAPVATPDIAVGRRGLVISTVLFGTHRPHFYPYRPRLLVYDWLRRSTVRLRDAAAARRYFGSTPRLVCPPLRSFAWGIRTSRYVPFA